MGKERPFASPSPRVLIPPFHHCHVATESERADPFAAFRQFFALERDVLVLSLAMFAFSLGFQMTGRYMARYLGVLGATSYFLVFGKELPAYR